MLNHVRPSVWPQIKPGRFASTIRTDSPDGCTIALLGLPDELGVVLNNGRLGACEGPIAFRDALSNFGADYDAATGNTLDVKIYDAGDIIPAKGDDADALNETHQRVTTAVEELHTMGLVPICIGGGHDLTFPAVRALSQHIGKPVGGINVDPHLDVRETAGSGMPYRKLIEGGLLDAKRFVELGIGRFSNSREHTEWLIQQGGTIILSDDLLPPLPTGEGWGEGQSAFHASSSKTTVRDVHVAHNSFDRAFETAFPSSDSTGFVSIDLDVIDGSQAPGVSSMNPSGLPVHLVCDIAHRAGVDPRVRHFDIMELSPPNDDPPGAGRTARIAAFIFLSFIAGFAQRQTNE